MGQVQDLHCCYHFGCFWFVSNRKLFSYTRVRLCVWGGGVGVGKRVRGTQKQQLHFMKDLQMHVRPQHQYHLNLSISI